MLADTVEAMSMFIPVGMFSVCVSTYVILSVSVCVCLHVLYFTYVFV